MFFDERCGVSVFILACKMVISCVRVSGFWVSHAGAGLQIFGPSSTASTDHKQGAGREFGTPETGAGTHMGSQDLQGKDLPIDPLGWAHQWNFI